MGVTVTSQGQQEAANDSHEGSSEETENAVEDDTTAASENTLGAEGGSEEHTSDNHIQQSVSEVIDPESEKKDDILQTSENREEIPNSDVKDEVKSDDLDNLKISEKNDEDVEERERLIADVSSTSIARDTNEDVVNV